MTDLSVILPAKDEAQNVEAVLMDAFLCIPNYTEAFEIIVVDDGSRDATQEKLQPHLDAHSNLKVIQHAVNQGYGAALRSGFAAAKGDLLFFTDCDGQFRFSDLQPMLTLMQAPDLNAVVGYRLNRQDSSVRKVYSWIYNRLAAFLCGIQARDINCAYKIFRRSALSAMDLHRTDYLINVEVLLWMTRLGLKWRELGVEHYPRIKGRSKIGLADSIRSFVGLLKIRRRIPANLPTAPYSDQISARI